MKTITLSEKSLNTAIQLSYTILKFHGVQNPKDVTIGINGSKLYLEFAADTVVKEYTIPL